MRYLPNQSGMTLIEIMVVVVILSILAAVVAPSIMGRPDQARVAAARNQIKSIETALNLYRLDNGGYPGSLDELLQPGRSNPDPYLDRVPPDPWGNEYQYRVDGRKVLIVCLGADGTAGGEGYDADLDNYNID